MHIISVDGMTPSAAGPLVGGDLSRDEYFPVAEVQAIGLPHPAAQTRSNGPDDTSHEGGES